MDVISLLDIVQDEDYRKCKKDLDFLRLSLSNVKVGYRQLLLDLPLDYHKSNLETLMLDFIGNVEEIIKEYENIIE